MDAYIFNAALYCAKCGKAICDQLTAKGLPDYIDVNNESTYDSDEFPKGPYGNGGGEADSPQHCDRCQVFLENPLTSDGYDYVREMAEDRSSCSSVVAEWLYFYEI